MNVQYHITSFVFKRYKLLVRKFGVHQTITWSQFNNTLRNNFRDSNYTVMDTYNWLKYKGFLVENRESGTLILKPYLYGKRWTECQTIL